jgi:hypothetical protein
MKRIRSHNLFWRNADNQVEASSLTISFVLAERTVEEPHYAYDICSPERMGIAGR